ncbi:MAG: hypothetical protein PHV34_06340 [Verrucomicrobiae bacterium]|nr:hypothetical protein [Verrucomicrobiae bacterium]
MKPLLHLIHVLFIACATCQASPESPWTTDKLSAHSSRIALISYARMEVIKSSAGEQFYTYYPAGQVSFKGEKLISPLRVLSPNPELFPVGFKFTPHEKHYAILFLKDGAQGDFEFAGGSLEQKLVDPEISVSLSSFAQFSDLVLYLLQSPSARNRRIGLIFAGGEKGEKIIAEVARLAKLGTKEEKERAGGVAVLNSLPIEPLSDSPSLSPSQEQAVKKELEEVLEAWKKHWNAKNWASLVGMFQPNSSVRQEWVKGNFEREKLSTSLSEKRKIGEILSIEVKTMESSLTDVKATILINYSNKEKQLNAIKLKRDGEGKLSVEDMRFPVKSESK